MDIISKVWIDIWFKIRSVRRTRSTDDSTVIWMDFWCLCFLLLLLKNKSQLISLKRYWLGLWKQAILDAKRNMNTILVIYVQSFSGSYNAVRQCHSVICWYRESNKEYTIAWLQSDSLLKVYIYGSMSSKKMKSSRKINLSYVLRQFHKQNTYHGTWWAILTRYSR